MKVAVVTYPGSSSYTDIAGVLKLIPEVAPFLVWHKEESIVDADYVLIPGGSAFGDYLRPGALAKLSPISGVIAHFANTGGKVIGIGNGFQILCELGILPGAFFRNPSFQFCNGTVNLKLCHASSDYSKQLNAKNIYNLPISCNFGRYFVDNRTLEEIEENQQIVFQYATAKGKIETPDALTGSVSAIAALTNREKNVLGILAHPERAVNELFGPTDGLKILNSFFAKN